MNKRIVVYSFIFVSIILVGCFFIFKYLNVLHIQKPNDEGVKDSLSIKSLDSITCECDIVKARKNIELGNFIAYYNYQNPYFEEIAFTEYGIYVQPTVPNVKRTCAIAVMDSAIYLRYGKDFFQNLDKKVDSINKLRPWNGVSLDGFVLYPDKEIKYKCGDFNTIIKLIVDSLTKRRLLPLEQNECIPSELIIDFVISELGKLDNIRVLNKLNPNIDSIVIKLLENLPCSWEPAENNGEIISFRKRMYFFFGKQPSPSIGLE